MRPRIFQRLRTLGLLGLLPLGAAAATAPASTPNNNFQYPTRAAAEESCPGEVVVWVDLETRIYYYRGQDRYGSGKQGVYMCQRDLKTGSGYRPNRSGH